MQIQVTDANGQPIGSVTLPDGTRGLSVSLPNGAVISGSVIANAGINLNTSALALEAGGNLAAINTNAGSTVDAAVVGDNSGSLSAKLRGLSKILNSIWSSANNWIQVSIQNASLAVTGTFWQATQPVSIATLPSLTAGTAAIGSINELPVAGVGYTPVFAGGIQATATAIKASAGTLGGWYIWNPNSTATYVQIFNIASGSVTLGTSVAVVNLCIPPGQAANLMGLGIAFSTAISFACTTTATGNTAPSTGLDCNFWYI